MKIFRAYFLLCTIIFGIWGNIFAGDQLVATVETVSSTVTPYYDHTDHLGSTNVVSDGSGAQVELLDYFPYGGQRISSGSYTGQKQFLWQMFDPDTSLNYLNARYYNGTRGQFVSQDTVFWEVGKTKRGMKTLMNPQTQNAYAYANDNPMTIKDPTGEAGELTATWVSVGWPLTLVDGPLPVGDIIYGAGTVVSAIADVTIATGDKIGAMVDNIKQAVSWGSWSWFTSWSNYQGQGSSGNPNNKWNKGDKNIIDSKISNQMEKRWWNMSSINETIENPFTTRSALNKATGNPATAYYNQDGSYAVRDNLTREVIQISDKSKPGWIPDSTIINPYTPN